MNINPSSPQGPRQSVDPGALESARAQEAQRPDSREAARATNPDARSNGADSVDVSSDAKALAEQREARSGKSSLSADRLKEISARLASGHYDRPEVIDQVARRVSRDPDFLGS